MKQRDRKTEAMHKIIISQAAVIAQLNKEITSLAEENRLLKARYAGISTDAAQYRGIISELGHQRNEYEKLNNDMKNAKTNFIDQQKR